MEHRDYMEQALALAREAAAHGEVPVGCVIVKDGKVIGRGRNRREEKQAVYSHAEMEAMAQAKKNGASAAIFANITAPLQTPENPA